MAKHIVKRKGRPPGIKDKNTDKVAKPKRKYTWRTMPAEPVVVPKGRKSRQATHYFIEENPPGQSSTIGTRVDNRIVKASYDPFDLAPMQEEAPVAKRKMGRPKGTKNSPYLLKKPDKLISEVFHEAKFKKGTLPGPGRPKGSRNKMTLALAKIGEDNVEDVFQRLVDIALGKIIGDAKACKAVIDTAITLRKITPINFELPAPIETTEDLNKFSKKIINMAAEGEMSAEEAMEYGKLCEQELKMMTDTDVVQKIEKTCLLVDLIKKGG